MKFCNSILFLMIVLGTTYLYAVDTHNVTVNIGGAFNTSIALPNVGVDNSTDQSNKAIGGGYAIEVGYLYLNPGELIQGVDTRAGFGQNFDELEKFNGASVTDRRLKAYLDSTFFYISSTYQLGNKSPSGFFLADIIGLSFGYMGGKTYISLGGGGDVDKDQKSPIGDHFLIGINLPLGLHFISSAGFMIGFRHRVEFAVSPNPEYDYLGKVRKGGIYGTHDSQETFVSYNIHIAVGFVFG